MPRRRYAPVLAELERRGAARVAAEVEARAARAGLSFDERTFELDPIPRIVESEEWELLGRGLAQRARALEAFLVDAYSGRRIVQAGVMPERVIETCAFYDPELRGAALPGRPLAVCGFDVVRDETGELLVLEDNARTPSGIAYAVAAREVIGDELARACGFHVQPLDTVWQLLAVALREAAPGVSDAVIAVLTDGPGGAYSEHQWAAREIGAPLVTVDDLELHGGAVRLRADGRRVDVVYRRSNEDRLRDESGALTHVGELLAEPVASGAVAVANAFGAGVADDKQTHAYVESMVRFYLGEEPAIRSVPSVDLGTGAAATLANLDEMVVKPREGEGGHGVVVPGEAGPERREAVRQAVREAPDEHAAQQAVELSTLPVIADDGSLEPRTSDLRAFALAAPGGFELAPCALTRFAAAGSLKVNSSSGGGGKDTWALA